VAAGRVESAFNLIADTLHSSEGIEVHVKKLQRHIEGALNYITNARQAAPISEWGIGKRVY